MTPIRSDVCACHENALASIIAYLNSFVTPRFFEYYQRAEDIRILYPTTSGLSVHYTFTWLVPLTPHTLPSYYATRPPLTQPTRVFFGRVDPDGELFVLRNGGGQAVGVLRLQVFFCTPRVLFGVST